jgi:prepilin-type N-terminal cleavage/methylation domain-containing protein
MKFNSRGFTLVELITVIVLLTVMVLLVTPSVINNVNVAKEHSYNQMVNNIESVATLYVRDNRDIIPNATVVNSKLEIKLQELVDDGLLKAPVIDPKTGNDISDKVVSVCVVDKNKYYVSYEGIDSCEGRDFIAPVITILGDNPLYITLGTTYNDPGVTVSDNVDKDIKATSKSTVNTKVAGTYSVVYNATDSSYNKAVPVTRIVIVDPATEYSYRDWVVSGNNSTVCDTCYHTCTRTLYRWYKMSCDCTCTIKSCHYYNSCLEMYTTTNSISNGIYYNISTCSSACANKNSGTTTCYNCGSTQRATTHVSGSGTCSKVYTSWSTSSSKPSSSYNSSWYETKTEDYNCNPYDCNCREVWVDTSHWGSWSAYSRTPVAATSTRQVQTRIVTSE